MYYIGEGGNNLKKMDKHIKRKQGNILNLFSTNVINDKTLNKMKKKKVKVLSSSMSQGISQASHSTAESANHAASSEFFGAADTKSNLNAAFANLNSSLDASLFNRRQIQNITQDLAATADTWKQFRASSRGDKSGFDSNFLATQKKYSNKHSKQPSGIDQ